ncbi:MAG: sigma-70 family RNA polymerase sigma factor [Ignavibacteriales bacterium]|nr:sigma-70 family RNA polymerase sigma factor [Ignavibacteriales bacterium]
MNQNSSLTEIDLFKNIAANDSKALETLYDRYSPLLFTLIKKIVSNDRVAAEILVDVFEILWKKIDKFNFSSENTYAWLVTLSRNKATDYLRRNNSPNQFTEPYNDEYEDNFIIPKLSDQIDSLDLDTAFRIKSNIERALSKLTDAQKYVIHLSYYEGYTQKGIADKLKIPLPTVKSKIKIALNNLRDNLIKEKE